MFVLKRVAVGIQIPICLFFPGLPNEPSAPKKFNVISLICCQVNGAPYLLRCTLGCPRCAEEAPWSGCTNGSLFNANVAVTSESYNYLGRFQVALTPKARCP